MFALIAANIAWHRPTTLLPTNAAERLIWATWIGFHFGLLAENASVFISGEPRQVTYSVSAILGGVCFFVMGVHVWGGCYVIGGLFFVLAPLLAAFPRYGPLIYGLWWGIAFTLLGAHYWRGQNAGDSS